MILVDTDVFSFVFKESPLAKPYSRHLNNPELCISFVTEAELFVWAEVYKWGADRVRALEDRIGRFTILGVRPGMARVFARIVAEGRRIGRQPSFGDVWIAATAIAYDIPLVTHNRQDFETIDGLRVISEGGN